MVLCRLFQETATMPLFQRLLLDILLGLSCYGHAATRSLFQEVVIINLLCACSAFLTGPICQILPNALLGNPYS